MKLNTVAANSVHVRVLLTSTLVITSSLGSWSCSRTSKAESGKTDQNKSIQVSVIKISRQNLSTDQPLTAEFRPYQEIDVHAKVSGYVKKMFVDVGDSVKQGQTLAILEIPEIEADLSQATAARAGAVESITRAEAELRRAEAAHEQAHVTYTRLVGVSKLQPRLIAQEEIDDALAKDREAEAQIATYKAAIAVAREKLAESKAGEQRVKTMVGYSRIDAPFTGMITKRYADTGSMIPAGTASSTQAMPLVRLSEVDRLRLVLPVPEAVVPQIRTGATVDVKVQSLDRPFKGVVWRSSGKIDTATRTMEVEVDVPNPGRVLKPGMYASVLLSLEHAPEALSVPVEAVSVKNVKSTVLLVNDNGIVEEREIKTGLETPQWLQVLSGLNENDLVIVGNHSAILPGQHVETKLSAAQKAAAD